MATRPSDVRAGGGYVELSTKTDDFEAGLNKSTELLRGFGAEVLSIGDKLANAGNGFTSGLSSLEGWGSSVAGVSDRLSEELEPIGGMLRGLGFDLEELTGKDLDELSESFDGVGEHIEAVSGAMTWATSALAVFRATGIFAVASFAAGVAVAAVTSAFFAGVWLGNIVIMGLYKLGMLATSLVVGTFNAVLAFGSAGFGAYSISSLVAKAATWLYTAAASAASVATTILSGGLTLLAAVVLPMLAVAFGATLLAPLVWIGYLAAKFVWATGVIQDSFSSVVDSAARTWDRVVSIFGELRDTFLAAYTGISDAIANGDWEAVMEIALAGLKLAWAQFSEFIRQTWTDWKFTALEIINIVSEMVVTTFLNAWTAVKIVFFQVWSSIKLAFIEGAKLMINVAADMVGTVDAGIARTMRSFVPVLQVMAVNERIAAPRNQAEMAGEAAFDAAERETNMLVRQMDLAAERDEAMENGNGAEVERLQEQLRLLNMQQAALREVGAVAAQAQAGDASTDKFHAVGGFDARGFAGMFGEVAGGAETPMERIANRALEIQQQQFAVQQQLVEMMRRARMVFQ